MAVPRKRWKWDALAFLWGLAEASFFFIAAEVLVTLVAMRDPVRALRMGLLAVLGATIGAAALYFWGARDAFGSMTLLALLPGLSPDIISAAEEALQRYGLAAVPAGVLSAATGKAHAILAHDLGIGFAAFIAVFAAIRLLRLLLAGCVAFCLGALLGNIFSRRALTLLWALAWAAIYVRIFFFLQ